MIFSVSPSPEILDARKQVIIRKRKSAKEGLVQEIERMKKDSDAKFQILRVDATVCLPLIPDFDRAKLVNRSILTRVLERTDDDLYELDTKSGRLQIPIHRLRGKLRQ